MNIIILTCRCGQVMLEVGCRWNLHVFTVGYYLVPSGRKRPELFQTSKKGGDATTEGCHVNLFEKWSKIL